jgi:PmbA protein
MLHRVVEVLQRQEGASDWLARHIQSSSTQHYVIGDRPESRRSVHSEKVVLTVMNDHIPAKGGPDASRGQAEVTVLPGDLDAPGRMQESIQRAVFMARLADNPPYGLPGPARYPSVELADPELQVRPREAAERLVQQLVDALVGEKDVRLSSAEVFVEQARTDFRNSRGAGGQQTTTKLLMDWVLLAAGSQDEMESHVAFERRRAAGLDVPALVRRHAQYARDALTASTPRTGTFPVVVSDEALAELLVSEGYSPLIYRSSGQLKYQRMSMWEAGAPIFDKKPGGDAFTMHSNAVLPFGMRSGCFDADGLPGQRLAIVEDGVLTRFWADQRYAEYLGVPVTGAFGNMEVAAGTHSSASLLDAEGPLYHIVAFSAMTPDPITGDFVGEIRLGYEIEKRRARPIRGGSVGGNLPDVLATARMSKETTFLGDYTGPRAMRFAQVTVAGA